MVIAHKLMQTLEPKVRSNPLCVSPLGHDVYCSPSSLTETPCSNKQDND